MSSESTTATPADQLEAHIRRHLLGRTLQEGARTVRIHGQDVPVRAKVETLDGFSAHADREEILRWLSGFRRPPGQTYIVHGEPQPAHSLADALPTRLRWNARVARDGETVPLVR